MFSSTTKGPYDHKAVGFIEPGESSRSDAPQVEIPILTGLTEELEFLRTNKAAGNGTDTASGHESESNLIGNEHLLRTLCELESIKTLRGVNLRGIRDPGVGIHPRTKSRRTQRRP